MAGLALALYVVYLAVAFGGRAWLQYRRTGDHGFRGFSGRVASVEWFAGLLFVVSLLALFLAPVSALLGILPSREPAVWIVWLALALVLLGFAVTLRAQVEMGTSWRVGVDPSERTELVTRGLFAVVRNPVFTGVGLFALGFALLVENALSLLGVVCGALGVELQVRYAEEPFLLRVHGETYRRYARRVGRFVPWLGHLRDAGGRAA
ncbi:MAG: isoprenylcysteine carboxylmethyltransferase family protein [Deltaproteobacteria bacterium]|nr:MAG: isoprenylcysteine carboxylmethyltransferase family protein [Deltaproteobacteria bacterium]